MKIGIDARVLVHRPTGVARYLDGLLRARADTHHVGEALELYVDRMPSSPPSYDMARVVRSGWPLGRGDALWRQLRLPWTVARRKPDVLFCPFYTVPLVSSVPSVVTVHDVSFAAHPEWFRRLSRLAFSLVGPSARKARRVLTVSQFSADEIVRFFGIAASKIEVVHAAVDEGWFEPVEADARQAMRAWLGTDASYVLHLGAVHTRRNVDRVIAAFADVARQHADLKLVIAGPDLQPGPDVQACVREHGLEERVVRCRWVPEEHLAPLIAEAQLMIYLSSYEGFGLPALEAMACGAPVVALKKASLPEVLGDCARWVDEPDAPQVASAVSELLSDETARAQLASAGRERARTFTWNKAAHATFEILRAAARH